MIDPKQLSAELERLCQSFCKGPIKVEAKTVEDGRTECAVIGQDAPWDAYTAGWDALTDAVDAYIFDHGWRFDRGEWSLSWDGGAIAEWLISE